MRGDVDISATKFHKRVKNVDLYFSGSRLFIVDHGKKETWEPATLEEMSGTGSIFTAYEPGGKPVRVYFYPHVGGAE